MKNKNKKRGFTLIELLITIALMLSLLGIAIVSFIGISNRKKNEAWGNVKDEIKMAGEQFFKSNEYLFEGVNDNVQGIISVGRLVDEDYLNIVTDPRTGKAVSACTKVVVTKKNGVFDFNVEEDNGDNNCEDSRELVIKSGKDSPEITVEKKCGSQGNGEWCKLSDSNYGVNITAKVNPTNNSSVLSFTSDQTDPNSGLTCTKSNNRIMCTSPAETSNTKLNKVTFIATSASGGKTTVEQDYKLDQEKPTGSFTIKSQNINYNSNKVNLLADFTDNYSGVDDNSAIVEGINKQSTLKNGKFDVEYNFGNMDGSKKNLTVRVSDKAGNENSKKSNDYKLYSECASNVSTKITSYGNWSNCSESCGEGTRKRDVVKAVTDNATGKACGNRTEKETGTCNLGNCTKLTCPQVTVLGTSGNNGWYKKGGVVYTEDGKDYYFALKITPTEGTESWDWYTNADGGKYTFWSTNDGTATKTLSDGKRGYKIIVKDASGKTKECIGSYNIETTLPKVKCDYLNIKHTANNSGTDRCGKYRTGSAVFKVKENGTVKHYNAPGTLSLDSYSCTAFALSGIKSHKADRNATYHTTSGGCLISEKENPCRATWKISYTSNAGNTTDYIFKFTDDYYKNGACDDAWYRKTYD